MEVIKEMEKLVPGHFRQTFAEFYERIEVKTAFRDVVKPSIAAFLRNTFICYVCCKFHCKASSYAFV